MRTLGKPKDNLQKFKLLLSNGGKPFEYSKNDFKFLYFVNRQGCLNPNYALELRNEHSNYNKTRIYKTDA